MGIVGDVHVKVTPEVLKEKAQTVSDCVASMERCLEEIENIVSRTRYYWVGEAGEKHRKLYTDQKGVVGEMMKRLKEHPTDLLVISQNYTAVEKSVSEMANRLAGDIIE